MATGKNLMSTARVAGSTLAVSFAQSHYGQITTSRKFTKIKKRRRAVSLITTLFTKFLSAKISVNIYYIHPSIRLLNQDYDLTFHTT